MDFIWRFFDKELVLSRSEIIQKEDEDRFSIHSDPDDVFYKYNRLVVCHGDKCALAFTKVIKEINDNKKAIILELNE